MLWFIGLGVSGIKSISEDIRKVIEDSDIVYLESFTSPISKSHEEKIKSLVRGDFKIAKRWFVEDGQEILRNAQTKKISLLSYGDPYIATTHIELRTRAEIENIETYYNSFINSPKTWHYRNKMEYSFSSIIYEKNNNCAYRK